ncbi:2-C-methyl-D-erythritol 2,4-cyclodiphosphate synthase [Thermovibrio sp.]
MLRVGIGYDAHKLVEGRKLIIGGVEIPHTKGLLGHSDADVLLHAICDALLGALSLSDIGELFPDTSNEFKGISSVLLLKRVNSLVKSKGYRVLNVDSVVVAQRPKLKPYRRQMVENIASALGILPSQVSVKFTTTEKMGFEGREEGISAQAVVLIGEVGKW